MKYTTYTEFQDIMEKLEEIQTKINNINEKTNKIIQFIAENYNTTPTKLQKKQKTETQEPETTTKKRIE